MVLEAICIVRPSGKDAVTLRSYLRDAMSLYDLAAGSGSGPLGVFEIDELPES